MIELTTEFLITLLVFIVLFSVGFTILRKVFDNKMPAAIISLSIALIGSWYLTTQQITFITQFYGTTQTILIMLIPLIVAFFFIYSFLDVTSMIRKSFWILYGAINIILLMNNSNISDNLGTNMITIVVVATLILVIFDTPIKNTLSIRKNLKKIK